MEKIILKTHSPLDSVFGAIFNGSKFQWNSNSSIARTSLFKRPLERKVDKKLPRTCARLGLKYNKLVPFLGCCSIWIGLPSGNSSSPILILDYRCEDWFLIRVNLIPSYSAARAIQLLLVGRRGGLVVNKADFWLRCLGLVPLVEEPNILKLAWFQHTWKNSRVKITLSGIVLGAKLWQF